MLIQFPREIGLRRNICESRDSFDSYVTNLNGKASCYTSLYAFGKRHPIRRHKMDIESVIIDRAWWDFDTPEGGSLSDVKEDVGLLLNRLNGDVRLVFTGRGFHVHQLFTKPVFGRAISKHIERYQREVARDLKTLDGVGHPQKLTRIPDTWNPTREKWSVNICAKSFAANPLVYKIPLIPDPRLAYLDPFRGEVRTSDFDIVQWISDNPMKELSSIITEFNGEIGSIEQIPIPPCLDRAIRHENPKHFVRVALAQHLAENLRWFAHPSTLTPEQRRDIVEKMVAFMATLGWRDFNPDVTRFHAESLVDYEKSPSSSWYLNNGLCDGHGCWAHEH